MRTGFSVSLAGHGLLLAAALVTWSPAPAPVSVAPQAVEVSLIRPEDAPQPGLRDAATPDPAPQTAAPAPAAPEPAPAAPATAPPPVDRVAPVPQPAPTETTRPDREVQEALRADPQSTPETEEAEPRAATAPEAAAPEIVTEATETADALPPGPPRPEARPASRPAPPDPAEPETLADAQPEPDTEPDTEPQPETDPAPDPVTAALEEAMRTPAPAASGPPLTAGERDGLRLAVGRCWNFSALSTAAAQVTVTVGMDMARDGTPANLRLVTHSGGGQDAARQAFETARRAILRCQPYALPAEKYAQWQQIEMTFNPDEMRRR